MSDQKEERERLALMADAKNESLGRRLKKQAHALAAAIHASPKRLAEMKGQMNETEREAGDWRTIASLLRIPEPREEPVAWLGQINHDAYDDDEWHDDFATFAHHEIEKWDAEMAEKGRFGILFSRHRIVPLFRSPV